MVQGGARPRSGPTPDPNALRRDRKSDLAGWTVLPSVDRSEPAPDWPLEGQSDREANLWSVFWRKPQAELWVTNSQTFEVALHVRCFAEAEQPGAATPLRTLVRQQADALLLTMPAMHAARVKIAADELKDKRAAVAISTPAKASSRSRLRAVDGDGA
jgi:hypothetical protein